MVNKTSAKILRQDNKKSHCLKNVGYNNRIWFGIWLLNRRIYNSDVTHVWNNCKGSQFFWRWQFLCVCDNEVNVHQTQRHISNIFLKMNFKLMTTSYKDLVRMVDPILFFYLFICWMGNGQKKKEKSLLRISFLGGGRLCVLLSSFSNLNRISIYLLAPAPAYPIWITILSSSFFLALDPGWGD